MVKIQAEIVNGRCPTCDEITMLVGLTPELFRCMNCGADLQQHINGKISYLPTLTGSTPLSQSDGNVCLLKILQLYLMMSFLIDFEPSILSSNIASHFMQEYLTLLLIFKPRLATRAPFIHSAYPVCIRASFISPLTSISKAITTSVTSFIITPVLSNFIF